MTDRDTLFKQHHDQYKNVLLFVIESNTTNFFEMGLKPIFKRPPLDSMDILRQKVISIAKNNDLVVDSNLLDLQLDSYRNSIVEKISEIEKFRCDKYSQLINSNFFNDGVFKLTRKQIKEIDKQVVNIFREILVSCVDSVLLVNMCCVLSDSHIEEFNNYVKKKYISFILSQFDSAIAIRNNTLINAIKEQNRRYIFTKKNSHLFD